ncbi:MAG: universal stress protein [Anaerolineaceae bacterium]|nr:MAG: universal stress protein [Anaerolineaceae bacterium]
MLEQLFIDIHISINVLFIVIALFIVTRAAHYLVDGAVSIAHEYNISPLIIGATVVAMGTTSAENTVNLVIVLTDGDPSTVIGNLLGSNLVNFGIELGVSALIAGLIMVPRGAFEKDIPLYFATVGLITVFASDGQISRTEALIGLVIFVTALGLIIQYARSRRGSSVLLVEAVEIEAISHPTARRLTRPQALLTLFGGLIFLVLSSRFLILNTAAVATVMGIPEFIIGLVIIGPGTSMPEIASSIQAARRGHASLVLGTVFGSCLFNLSLGLGLPAVIQPLPVGETAILSLVFINVINLSLLALLLIDLRWIGRARTITRVTGAYLVITYIGFISYLVVDAAGGSFESWGKAAALVLAVMGFILGVRRGITAFTTARAARDAQRGRILCATRGGQASQPTHQKAIEIALERNAELIFLYVFDQRAVQQVATPIVINVSSQMEHMRVFLRNTAQRQATKAGVRARVRVRAGSLREQIQTIANEQDVDLIVMGNPSEKTSLFKREALRALADEIEAETGIEVLALSGQEIKS